MQGILLDDSHELQIKIKRDTNGLITQGLVIGDITFQNQEIIVVSEKGEIKSAPLKGVGILSFLDDEVPDNLLREIRTELAVEGMQVNKLSIDNRGKLEIDAKYNNQ